MALCLTGANGFIGSALLGALSGYTVSCIGRTPVKSCSKFIRSGIDATSDYSEALKGVDTVIHSAGRAHVMDDPHMEPLKEYRAVNSEGTLNLARQAALAGASRFIFLSSIKVNGESTNSCGPFSSADVPSPEDDYGISKAEAEDGLKKIALETGMEFVIIRPPLVYGPSVKANFATMMKLAQKNLPLPLGAIYNKRSLVALDNLVDLIITCIDHPEAANQTFLVSDDHDVSTTELLEMMIKAIGKRPRLLPVPASWLNFVGKLAGKQAVIDRLCGNLQVDISHTKNTLSWKPPVSFEDGIKCCFIGD